MMAKILGLAIAAMLAGGGCAYDLTGPPSDPNAGTSSAASGACVPGSTAFCDCGGGASGVHVCASDGFYGACDCTGTPATGGDGQPTTGTDGQAPSGAPAWAPTCTSDRHWTGGSDGGARMYPGRNCISCHANGGGGDDGEEEDDGGPRFSLGGTVYPALHDEDDCYGLTDAVVRIDAANGAVYSFTTNATGNFYRSAGQGSIATPYRATVLYQGRELAMQGAQTDLNCANCHTLAGAAGAPGRIVAP